MENDVLELVQVQNTSMNSTLKRKNAQRININSEKNYMTPKQETIKTIKVLLEVMTIME